MHVKNRTFYFFDEIINIKNHDPNKIQIDEKSYKTFHIYYIGYVMVKDFSYTSINSVNILCLIIINKKWVH